MLLYTIKLSQTEIEDIKKIFNKGSHTTQFFQAAYILLNCDKVEFYENKHITNEEICKILKLCARTIDRVKKQFIEEGFESTLERHQSTQISKKKADGDLEAKLVALCCSNPPEGFYKWSLRLLADKIIELEYVDYISHVEVLKNELNPWKVKGWVIPPNQSCQFVANMEHVLDIYNDIAL